MQVLLDGRVVALLERSCPRRVKLPDVTVFFSEQSVLSVVVHAMGRNSGGCAYDPKGLVYPNIRLNGAPPAVHLVSFIYFMVQHWLSVQCVYNLLAAEVMLQAHDDVVLRV